MAKLGESGRQAVFSRGAIRYVDSTDHLSLEFVGSSPVALENAIATLSDRWANRHDVEVEFINPPGLVSASASEVLQNLRLRLDNVGPAKK